MTHHSHRPSRQPGPPDSDADGDDPRDAADDPRNDADDDLRNDADDDPRDDAADACDRRLERLRLLRATLLVAVEIARLIRAL